jgi:hypothetical protein
MQHVIPLRVDWSAWPALAPELPYRIDEWQREYDTLVEKVEFRLEPWTSSWFGPPPLSDQLNPSPVCDPTHAERCLIPSLERGGYPNVHD